jgi:hypothetical protein
MNRKNYYTVELVDVDEDGKLDVLLGGHEHEGASTVVLLNPGDSNFANVVPTVLPSVSGESIVLDFLITGTAPNRVIWVLRTSGGDGTSYQSRTIQRITWPDLSSSVPMQERPAQWIPWLIDSIINGSNVIVSDDARFPVIIPR